MVLDQAGAVLIDFRYFLISIVAVFLALGIGIVMGSGVLGGPILEGLESQIRDVLNRNNELQQEVIDLDRQVDDKNDFANAIEPLLVDGALTGAEVVVFEIDGSDGDLVEGISRVVEEADGSLATQITLNEALTLDDEEKAGALAELLDASTTDPAVLRAELGRRLGEMSAAAAEGTDLETGSRLEDIRIQNLLEELAESDLVSVNLSTGTVIPPGSVFVVAAGSTDSAPFDGASFVEGLGEELDASGDHLVAAETEDSAWGLIGEIRRDDETTEIISTIDNADTPQGRVALALTLDLPPSMPAVHLGVKEGAAGPLPSPSR